MLYRHLDRSSYRLLTALALVGVIALGGTITYKYGGVGADSVVSTCQAASSDREVIANVDFSKTTANLVTAGVTLTDASGKELKTSSASKRDARATFTYAFKTGTNYQLFARGSDSSQSEIKTFSLKSNEGKVGYGYEVNLILEPTYQLSGKVNFVNGASKTPVPKGTVTAKGIAGTTPLTYDATVSNGSYTGLRLMKDREYKVSAMSSDGKKSAEQTVKIAKDEIRDFEIKVDAVTTGTIIYGQMTGAAANTANAYSVRLVPTDNNKAGRQGSAATSDNSYRSQDLTPGGEWYVAATVGSTAGNQSAGIQSYAGHWQKVSVGAGEQKEFNLEVLPRVQTTVNQFSYNGKTSLSGNLNIYESDEQANSSKWSSVLAVGHFTIAGAKTSTTLPGGSYILRGSVKVGNKDVAVKGSLTVPNDASRPNIIDSITLTDASKTSLNHLWQWWVGTAQASACRGQISGYVADNAPGGPRGQNLGLNGVTVKLTKIENGQDGETVTAVTKAHPGGSFNGSAEGYYEFPNLKLEDATYRIEALSGKAQYYSYSQTRLDMPYIDGVATATEASKLTINYPASVSKLEPKKLLMSFSTSHEDPFFMVKPTWNGDAAKLGAGEPANQKYRSSKDFAFFNCRYKLTRGLLDIPDDHDFDKEPQLCHSVLSQPNGPVDSFAKSYHKDIEQMIAKGQKTINLVVKMALPNREFDQYAYAKIGSERPQRAQNTLSGNYNSKKEDVPGKYKLLLATDFTFCVGAVNNFTEGKQLTDSGYAMPMGWHEYVTMYFRKEATMANQSDKKKEDIIAIGLTDLLDLYEDIGLDPNKSNKSGFLQLRTTESKPRKSLDSCSSQPNSYGVVDQQAERKILDFFYSQP